MENSRQSGVHTVSVLQQDPKELTEGVEAWKDGAQDPEEQPPARSAEAVTIDSSEGAAQAASKMAGGSGLGRRRSSNTRYKDLFDTCPEEVGCHALLV